MFKKSICAVVLGISSISAAADVKTGLGFSVDSESRMISMPFDIGQNIRIEPSISYSSTESASAARGTFSNSIMQLSLGVGLYKLNKLSEQLGMFYGAKLAYGKAEIDPPSSTAQNADSESYSIQPTFGVEYFLSEHFVVGGDVFMSYSERHGERDGDNYHTGSRLNVKFFF